MIDAGLAAQARQLLADHPHQLSDDDFLSQAIELHDLIEGFLTDQPACESVLLRRRMTEIWSRSGNTAEVHVELRYPLFQAGHLDEPGPLRQLWGHVYCAAVQLDRALSGERLPLRSAERHYRDALRILEQNSGQRQPIWVAAGEESTMALVAVLCCLYEQDRELLAAGGPTAQRIRGYLDEAIERTEQAPATPERIHAWRAGRGRTLLYRWADADPAVRTPADIDEAVSLLESAAAEPGYLGLGSRKMLAEALIERRRGSGDLVRAIELLSVWIGEVSPDMVPAGEASLAQARMFLDGDDQHFDVSYRNALASGRLRVAWDAKTQHAGWLRWSMGRTHEAAQAYLAAFRVLPGLVGLQGERPDKEAVLLQTGRAASTAATDLIRSGSTGDIIDAIMVLEASRAVMLGEMLDLNSLQAAPEDGPERVRLAQLSASIAALENAAAGRQLTPAQAHQLNRAYGEYAALTGNSTHSRPTVAVAGLPTWRTVCRAARPAPLVYLTAGDCGGGAVIVPHGSNDQKQLIGINLPRLNHQTVLELVARLRRMDELEGQDLDPETGESRIQIMTHVLETLWDCAMEKVVEELGGVRLAVLLAGGLLGMLPLHAAGKLPQNQPQSWRFALDSIAFTYAPSVASMNWARTHRKDASRWRRLLVLAPPDDSPRPMSREAELDALSQLEGLVVEKIDTVVDRGTLMGALQHHDVFHFAGHGQPSAMDPLSGGLYLSAGQTLRVAWFLAEPPHPGRVAVIPGCSTAMIGDQLPEESVGLPTALLQAGFTDVMATQWRVEGGVMAGLIDRLYRRWREPGTHPAIALAGIQRDLFRSGDNGRALHPLYWAPFTHTGG
ncbi:CHAT domain-containing protein [Streptomyces sp. NBC_01207]|uniref:CHAT domain-containing protein n=1 Tax=Streptomyces sp. NBC_01207 TaxID=2903772 RepID=UPI002E118C6C|nr:CHAT domain-containing protein [Streptomyces sp. NBC_01207]